MTSDTNVASRLADILQRIYKAYARSEKALSDSVRKWPDLPVIRYDLRTLKAQSAPIQTWCMKRIGPTIDITAIGREDRIGLIRYFEQIIPGIRRCAWVDFNAEMLFTKLTRRTDPQVHYTEEADLEKAQSDPQWTGERLIEEIATKHEKRFSIKLRLSSEEEALDYLLTVLNRRVEELEDLANRMTALKPKAPHRLRRRGERK